VIAWSAVAALLLGLGVGKRAVASS
jgi:hypothetical protein